MLHPPPPPSRPAPQTRKRKHEEQKDTPSTGDEQKAAPSVDEDQVVAPLTGATTEDGNSDSRSDTAASEPVREPVPEPMAVDPESEGDQEVEKLLRFDQSCKIAEAKKPMSSGESQPEFWTHSGTPVSISIQDAELQYPESPSEEAMDVDATAVPQETTQPPESDVVPSREESSCVDAPTAAEDAQADAELEGSTPRKGNLEKSETEPQSGSSAETTDIPK
ncbi:hypothetical protein C8Q73DRAFT_805509 [Cubamyces lactineus]|nr:hypothetical protein C8Q73DRAFT_805509 [Cubamyces lactineus]